MRLCLRISVNALFMRLLVIVDLIRNLICSFCFPVALEKHRIKAFILNKNYYSTLDGLVDSFRGAGILVSNIYIVDLGSSSEKVFGKYSQLERSGVTILFKSDIPFGPWIVWRDRSIRRLFVYGAAPIIVTDSDIKMPESLPSDWLEILTKCLRVNPFALKCALPLRTSGITSAVADSVLSHETKLKSGRLNRWLSFPAGVNFQDTDTTIALYKPFPFFNYHSIRLALPYEVEHLTWYSEFLASEEYRFYLSQRLACIGDWHS